MRRRVLGLIKSAFAGRLMQRLRQDRDLGIIARSDVFDPTYYLRRYPDIAFAKVNPILHYVRCGAAEGRDPSPVFDTGYYRATNPDVGRAGMNALAHYIRYGRAEGRKPHWGTSPIASDLQPITLSTPSAEIGKLMQWYGLDKPEIPWNGDLVQAAARIAAAFAKLPDDPPAISILIPVYNQIRNTLACLESLALQKSRYSFEVLIGDDHSSDQTASLLCNIPHLRLIRGKSNQGFLSNCNATAIHARGRILVLLNNDTVVLPGWLDALIAPFQNHDNVGLVGSRLLFPDGRQQEAGGIIWADGSGWNWGRGDDPSLPRYSHLRQVDYCSGAGIAIPLILWRQLGGFDPRYKPAYYEDTDLCFRINALGLKVLYQPDAVLIHCEGISHGTDDAQGGKRHQRENRLKFLERWQSVLSRHGMPDAPLRNFAERSRLGRILLIDTTIPTPNRDSGSVDTVNLMRLLRGQGYHVSFLPENLTEFPDDTGLLRNLGVECFHLPHVTDLKSACQDLAPNYDAVIVCRQPLAEKVLPILKQAAPQVPIIFNTIDLHFLRLEREAQLFPDHTATRHASEVRRSELASIDLADATMVVSRHEADLLHQLQPKSRIHQIPLIRRQVSGPFPSYHQRQAVLFIGGFRHTPNQDAVRFLLEDIWPRARKLGLTAPLHIVGSHIPSFLQDDPKANVRIIGHVPDLADAFKDCRLSIAPIRYGAGLKGKVIDSIMHCTPVIATSIAVEGSGLCHDHHVLVADDADGLAHALVKLYHSAALWQRLNDEGQEYCRTHYTLEAVDLALRHLLTELGLPKSQDGP